MASLAEMCRRIASNAKAASLELALVSTEAKNQWLIAAADALVSQSDLILTANESDRNAAPALGLNAAAIDRLTLTPARIRGMADGVKQVALLPDPVGEIRESSIRPNGLSVQKIGVPLGVIFFLYESRPNVTADAAALCVKSGNAVILRGGKEAARTNAAIHAAMSAALPCYGLPADAVQLVPFADREAVGEFLKFHDLIDLVIPRGGESLIRRVADEATMPVLKHYRGNCHVFVERTANADMAERIIINAKTQRPGVCNAAESLLIDKPIAESFLPRIAASLKAKGVELRGCPQTVRILPGIHAATEEDYATEYLDLVLSIAIVEGLDEAVKHITRYGSQHTDAIVTQDDKAANAFIRRVDSAAVVVNASTRFNDGFELGLGAEIGISTDKFHARGPCGLRELTTYKYIISGTGQTRS
ncbi:MAG: glutamate-5-semialdehyde dehydrogenase [Gemmataceae bacterium]